MRSTYSFLSLLLLTIFVHSCNSYQLASYYDNSDGIYVSNSGSSSYQKIFDDIVYNIPEEDLTNSSPNLPWGDNPDSTEVVYNLFPSYNINTFYQNYYSPFNSFRLNPYFNNYYMHGFNNRYYSPYGYFFSPYNSLENQYWYYFRFSRYYPYYNYRGQENFESDYYLERNSIASYSKVNSRRGEKNYSVNENDRNKSSRITDISNRGSNIILSNSNFEKIENDRVINNPKIDEIRTYQSDRTYRRNSNVSRESVRVSNMVPNLNSIKKEQIKNTYREARSFRNPIRPVDYNNTSSNNYNRINNSNSSNFNRTNNRSNSYNSRPNTSNNRSNVRSSASSISRSSSGGTSRSSSGSRGTSSRGSGKIN